MSLVLSTAVHGPEINLPLYLDDDLQYRFETGTAIGGPASGIYDLVTASRVDSDTSYNHGVEIYRADLEISGSGGSKPVVLKIATTQDSFESLVNEGRFYAAHLGPLVDESLVPICYGAFRVLNRQKEEHAFGDTNGRAENIRAEVLSAVFKLHQHGVVHSDLKFHHITLLNGRTPCIIGFTSAIAEHNCECIMSETQLWGIPKPLKDEVGCLEVYHVCEFMNIFVPGTFECFDMRHSASHIMDSSLQEVADEAPPGTDPAKALQEAYEAAHTYLIQWFPDAARLFETELQTKLDERCRQYKAEKEAEPAWSNLRA